ncbi:MAG TPA: ADOP family duplicated permease [Anaeromyxobacter sp.]|nr:ADOP family duplicated permease [Anaeromyxobacter sp.]
MSFLRDLRFAARTLLRAPAFLLTAAVVLALGVAAVTVMFGFLRVAMTPPPLDRIDRVFSLSVRDLRHDEPERAVALQDIEDWNREQKSFEGVAGMLSETVSFRRQGADAEPCRAARVTGMFFSLLRVKPLLGRALTSEDARDGAAPVLVISESLWRSAFNADRSVLGESVRVNGETFAVVGVAPSALDLPVSTLLWIPDRTDTTHDFEHVQGGDAPMPRILAPWMAPLGRLRDGVAPDAARAELEAIQARRVARYPEVASERPDVRPLSLLWMGGDYERLFRVLLGGVVLVLALSCVNVAGLLLVRGAGRTHEAAVRRALGAGRLRLSSQMLAESAVIGAAAAFLALVLAESTMELLRRVIPAAMPAAPSWWRMRLDGGTVVFAFGAALLAALTAGLYPALRATRVSVDPLLREGQRETGLYSTRLVRWMVVFEIALSSALLTAAGLVIRSGATLGRGDVGIPTAGFLLARIELPPRYYLSAQWVFIQRLMYRARDLPGVESAALSTSPPGISPFFNTVYALKDRSSGRIEELPSAGLVLASPGYFESFRIPVTGRTFVDTDSESRSTVGVVSESLARAAWPGQNPIGKEIQIAPQETWLPAVRVIGVAQDVRYDERLRALGSRPPVIYVCMFQWPVRWLYLTLRAPKDPLAAAEGIREVVRQLDSDVAVFSVRSLDDERQRNAAALSLVGRMFAVFGGVALLLAAAGVYGVVAYSVAQGAREIGIRRALGAPRLWVAAAVLARSAWQLAAGLLAGLALAPGVGALVGSVVFQPESRLPVYLWVAAVMSGTLSAAVLVPLWRVLSLQPSAALRHS